MRASRFQRLLFALALPLLLAALTLPALAAPAGERRVALVIGNGAYKAGPLKNPANDARDMAAALRGAGFEVILRENAGLRQMNESIDQFWNSLKKGGVGLFFFAGHGVQVAGENYLVPVDARIAMEKDVQYECVNAGKVLGRMEDAGNGLNIVILDACRNNPFARSFRSADRGLAKMDAPTGSLIAFATAPGDVAADGEGKNGLYTSHLLRHLNTPGLTIENVLKRTRIGVAADSSRLGRKQTPWESSSLMGDFFFVGGGQAPGLAPVPASVPSSAPVQVSAPVQQAMAQPKPAPQAPAQAPQPAPQPAQQASVADQSMGRLGARLSASQAPRPGVSAPVAHAPAPQPAAEGVSGLKVRIVHTPGGTQRAREVKEMLAGQGVSVELFPFSPNGSENNFKGRLFYAPGQDANARRVAELVQPLEPMQLWFGPSNLAGDISLWVVR